MKVGQKLRQLRQKRDWTLAELSKQSGIALSTLSRIETGQMTGTLESHIQIAKTLGVRLPELYADIELDTVRPVPRKLESGEGSGSTLLTAGTLSEKKMLPAVIRLEGGKSSTREPGAAGSERFLYVVKGKIELSLGEERFRLGAGETLHFPAAKPHTLHNTGGSAAVVLSVTAPPTV